MKRVLITMVTGILIAGMVAGCARRQKHVYRELKDPGAVDCATADGDLRMLQHEKANVAERIAEGVTAIYPAGLVIGILTLTERTKIKVAIGDYNKAIDERIAQIKSTCNVQ